MRKSLIALVLFVLATGAGTSYAQTTVPRNVTDSTYFRAAFGEQTQFGNPTYIGAYGQTNSLNGFGVFGTANVSGGKAGGFLSNVAGTIGVNAHPNIALLAVGANGVSGVNIGLEVGSNSLTTSGLNGRAIQVDSGDVYLGRSVADGGPVNTTYVNTLNIDGPMFASGSSAGLSNNLLISQGAASAPAWQDAATVMNSIAWLLGGNTVASEKKLGTINSFDLPIITANTERMRISASTGYVGINTILPGQLLDVKGNIRLLPVAGPAASQLQFQNPAGTKVTTFAAGAQANDINYTLPTSQGTTGTVLTNSDGAGTLTWKNPTQTITNGVTTIGPYASDQTDLPDLRDTATIYRISASGNINIAGVAAAGVSSGRQITFVNISGGGIAITFTNQDGTCVTATDRIITNSTGAAETILPNDAITFWYDGTTGRWRLMNKSY